MIHAKKGDNVVFNGRYDLLPNQTSHRFFDIGQVYTVSEDMNPGDSTVKLHEVSFDSFNSGAFENVIEKSNFDPKITEIQAGYDSLSISLEYDEKPEEAFPSLLYIPNPDHANHYHISLSDSAVVKLHKWLSEYIESKK